MSRVELPPKVCPSCRVEYLHTAEVCSDCGVTLVAPEEVPDTPPDAMPPASELVVIRAETASWIDGLGERFEEAGIPHRIELVPQPAWRGRVCAILVRPEDEERAREVDAVYLRAQLPDLADVEPQEGEEDEGEDGGGIGPLAEADDACPGCGTTLGADASECPECGLCFEPQAE